MDAQNAQIRLNKARQEWEQALNAITKLTRADSEQAIHQAMQFERIKWRKLAAARHELVEACMESIGR